MVANMRVGNMDGFCVGEPWNNRAIVDKIGFTAETTQDIWKDHPEKTLGTTAEFVAEESEHRARDDRRGARCAQVHRRHGATARRSPRSSPTSRTSTARSTSSTSALEGNYDNGIGKTWKDPDYMKFYNDGVRQLPVSCPTACGS